MSLTLYSRVGFYSVDTIPYHSDDSAIRVDVIIVLIDKQDRGWHYQIHCVTSSIFASHRIFSLQLVCIDYVK